MSRDEVVDVIRVVDELPTDRLALKIANTALELVCNLQDERDRDHELLTAMSERLARLEDHLGITS